MGITERKERERSEMRALILQAAMSLFVERGFENTSMRAIADRIEYSPTTLYLYFKDKTELLHALHTEAFNLMVAHFQQLVTVADPFERLIAQGREYIRFAMMHPGLYELMFVQKISDQYLLEEDKEWEEGDNAFDFLRSNVQACIDAGYFPQVDVDTFSFYIWGSLHGLIALCSRTRCFHVVPAAKHETLMTDAFGHFTNTLNSLKLVANTAPAAK